MSYHFLLIFSTFYSKNFYTLFPTLSIVLLSTNFFNILPFLGIFLGMFSGTLFSGTLSKNRFHLFLYLVLKLKNRFIKVFKSLINLWCRWWDSNPHGFPLHFECSAYTNFATSAGLGIFMPFMVYMHFLDLFCL